MNRQLVSIRKVSLGLFLGTGVRGDAEREVFGIMADEAIGTYAVTEEKVAAFGYV